MINIGIININLVFETRSIAHWSVLSPFLSNIYMNEFDSFVAELRQEKFVPFLKNDIDNYKKIKGEFRNSYFNRSLKKYGSVENVNNELNLRLKNHYKTYRQCYEINTKIRQIFYTRYADDFVFGIIGSKSFAVEIQS